MWRWIAGSPYYSNMKTRFCRCSNNFSIKVEQENVQFMINFKLSERQESNENDERPGRSVSVLIPQTVIKINEIERRYCLMNI